MSYEKPSGYTGGLVEEELLGGHKKVDWDKKRFWTKEDAIEFAKNNQPEEWGKVDDPKPRFANDMHALIADRLELDDYSNLKIYNATGTPLDLFYGVDLFLEYQDQIVTIDITLNKSKTEYKADFIFNPEKEDMVVLANFITERFLSKKATKNREKQAA